MKKWYFETSGFNHLLRSLDFDVFLNTRELQLLNKNELCVSPVTLWELMLTSDDFKSDFLIFAAQNLFSKRLLATPTEIIIRYLTHAYPENKINYDIYTDLEIGDLWSKMTTDNSVNINYDKTNLVEKTSFIRKISRNLPSIVYCNVSDSESWIVSLSKIVDVHYECLRDDGFLPSTSKYDGEILFKLVVLMKMLFFVFRMDFDSSVVEEYWKNIECDSNPTKRLMYLDESYPELFRVGPLLEMSVMAYNQVSIGDTNRGLLLDCYHMVYAPYVDFVVTGDEGFDDLKKLESRYTNKIIHVSDMNIHAAPYVSLKK